MWWFRLKKAMTPSKLREAAKARQVKYWLFVTLALCLLFYWTSDGEFSFLLTLASTIQMLSYLPLVIGSTTEGLSFYTFMFFVGVHGSRLSSILIYPSYLPSDSTGDWLYQIMEIGCFIFAIILCFKVKRQVHDPSLTLLSIPLSALMALLVHPHLNNSFVTDTLWSFSMYLESTALLPIRFEVRRMHGIESFSVHFLVAQGVCKVLYFVFWLNSYTELNIDETGLLLTPGNMIFLSQLVSCIVTADYTYYYVKSAVSGSPFILPV